MATAADTKASSAAAVKEHAPSGVDATAPMVSTQAQSDVSMFVVDPSVSYHKKICLFVEGSFETGSGIRGPFQRGQWYLDGGKEAEKFGDSGCILALPTNRVYRKIRLCTLPEFRLVQIWSLLTPNMYSHVPVISTLKLKS